MFKRSSLFKQRERRVSMAGRLTPPSMPLATSARAAAACSLAGLATATATTGANVLDGARAVEREDEYTAGQLP